MRQKYNLIQDKEDDSPSASIQRHLSVAALLVIVPIVALVVLSMFFGLSAARHRANIEREQREAIMTQVAMPTRAPRPTSTPLPPPTVARDTAMRTGPALRFDAIGTLEAGEPVAIVGRDVTGKWYLLGNGYWIAAITVVGDVPDVPIEPH